jgi:hypothetical protein
VREVEELRDTLVGAAQQLRVHVGVDDLLTDGGETATAEEVDLEGETEQPRQTELDRAASSWVTIAPPTP